jgi:very-short-patch-repair endonuclease
VHFRRTNLLPEHHVLVLPNGMRVTTVARTIYDLGGILDAAAHRNVLTDAINRGIVTLAEVVAVGHEMAGRGRPGSRAHHRLAVSAPESVEGVMSEGELVLGDALRRAGIPVVRQHAVRLPSGRQARLDLALPDCRLDIEVDHPTWHATPEALQSDHSRDNEMTLLEWEHVRFTSDDVGARLATCVAIVRTVARRLGAGGP